MLQLDGRQFLHYGDVRHRLDLEAKACAFRIFRGLVEHPQHSRGDALWRMAVRAFSPKMKATWKHSAYGASHTMVLLPRMRRKDQPDLAP